MHATYHGWKAAVRKKYPEAKFEGNKDICQAFNGRFGVGEWDGAKGELYRPKSDENFDLIWIKPESVPELPILLTRMEVTNAIEQTVGVSS